MSIRAQYNQFNFKFSSKKEKKEKGKKRFAEQDETPKKRVKVDKPKFGYYPKSKKFPVEIDENGMLILHDSKMNRIPANINKISNTKVEYFLTLRGERVDVDDTGMPYLVSAMDERIQYTQTGKPYPFNNNGIQRKLRVQKKPSESFDDDDESFDDSNDMMESVLSNDSPEPSQKLIGVKVSTETIEKFVDILDSINFDSFDHLRFLEGTNQERSVMIYNAIERTISVGPLVREVAKICGVNVMKAAFDHCEKKKKEMQQKNDEDWESW